MKGSLEVGTDRQATGGPHPALGDMQRGLVASGGPK